MKEACHLCLMFAVKLKLCVTIACYVTTKSARVKNNGRHGVHKALNILSGPSAWGGNKDNKWEKLLKILKTCIKSDTTVISTLYEQIQQYFNDLEGNKTQDNPASSWSNTLNYLQKPATKEMFTNNVVAYFQGLKQVIQKDLQSNMQQQSSSAGDQKVHARLIKQIQKQLKQILKQNCGAYFTNDDNSEEDGLQTLSTQSGYSRPIETTQASTVNK
ncbi:unnamed protein product [Didymodactylos carnosus]|uniref:Uncharacterized protein n=1 Tax=Didymodactylos carnosus TaxID=1234261 RepID=A0A813Q9Z0_9BILA|nr:unnamed protein product [Didymodactylos carnosus]CAF0764073.1 unnamed protein product [Didymodactylos carnosus]CAF3531431.1 unnamed protein product [Didymodactylos carnosus]CAF3545236.1 unnamed protein product [Didymodactylos carnosus]